MDSSSLAIPMQGSKKDMMRMSLVSMVKSVDQDTGQEVYAYPPLSDPSLTKSD